MGDSTALTLHTSAGSNPKFAQQGSTDWVNLANSTVSFSFGVLRRISGAGVEGFTYAAAIKMVGCFNISQSGERRIEEAVAKLRGFPGFKEALWFGYGYRSFVHDLAVSVPGMKLLGLCACLSEYHTQDVSARILSALWTALGHPDECKPSLSQFTCLIRACDGVLVHSTFQDVLRVVLGKYIGSSKLISASVDSICQVLCGLFDISRGHRHQIKVAGHLECGFIAALAEWLLGLTVFIEDTCESNRKVLFQSAESAESAQVHIVFEADYASTAKPSLELVTSTFVLLEPLVVEGGVTFDMTVTRHRLDWRTMFRTVAAVPFNGLLANLDTVTNLFLGVARLLQICVENQRDIRYLHAIQEEGKLRNNNKSLHPRSYGDGLIETIRSTFPEIEAEFSFQSYPAASSLHWQTACERVANAWEELIQYCKCDSCSQTRRSNLDSECRSEDFYYRAELKSCVLELSLRIIWLGILLGSTQIDLGIKMLHDGFLNLDRRALVPSLEHMLENKQWQHHHRREPALFACDLLRVLWFSPRFSELTSLFCGDKDQTLDHCHTAYSGAGVCVFRNILVEPTADPIRLSILHVVAGRISHNGYIYERVGDLNMATRETRIDVPGLISTVSDQSALDLCIQTKAGKVSRVHMAPLVTETAGDRDINFGYQFTTDSGRAYLQPTKFSNLVATRISHGSRFCGRTERYCEKLLPLPVIFPDVSLLYDNTRHGSADVMATTGIFVWKLNTDDQSSSFFALHRLLEATPSGQRDQDVPVAVITSACLGCGMRTLLETAWISGEYTKNSAHILWYQPENPGKYTAMPSTDELDFLPVWEESLDLQFGAASPQIRHSNEDCEVLEEEAYEDGDETQDFDIVEELGDEDDDGCEEEFIALIERRHSI